MKMYIYDENFFAKDEKYARELAEIIMPYIIKQIKPKSIVDFGCGEGVWLSVVKSIDKGIEVFGIDGDYINKERLKIPKSCFCPANLEEEFRLAHRYDLAISLEVAEHLKADCSDTFMETITQAADKILFSAAIPEQGGVNHINEQWQSYWIKKFASKGYCVDVSIRNYFWNDERIVPWRRQNILFFSKSGEIKTPTEEIYDVVHPQMFEYKIQSLTDVNKIDIRTRYCMIDNKIKELIEKGYKKVIIYPFGENGFLCKEILNHKYHIKELAIADNNLCKKNADILSVDQLQTLNTDYCVIENCSNIRVHKEVLMELKKYINRNNIFSIFEDIL